jgi:tRNA(Arg) A34 adenosine deaminase TadA
MCAGAVYWTGIGRVVYALSEHSLLALTGDHPKPHLLPALPRGVCTRTAPGGSAGPMLEDEAAAPHHGFWTQD